MMNTVISQLVISFIVIEAHNLHRRTVSQCDLFNDQILTTNDSKVNFKSKNRLFKMKERQKIIEELILEASVEQKSCFLVSKTPESKFFLENSHF